MLKAESFQRLSRGRMVVKVKVLECFLCYTVGSELFYPRTERDVFSVREMERGDVIQGVVK